MPLLCEPRLVTVLHYVLFAETFVNKCLKRQLRTILLPCVELLQSGLAASLPTPGVPGVFHELDAALQARVLVS